MIPSWSICSTVPSFYLSFSTSSLGDTLYLKNKKENENLNTMKQRRFFYVSDFQRTLGKACFIRCFGASTYYSRLCICLWPSFFNAHTNTHKLYWHWLLVTSWCSIPTVSISQRLPGFAPALIPRYLCIQVGRWKEDKYTIQNIICRKGWYKVSYPKGAKDKHEKLKGKIWQKLSLNWCWTYK